MCEPIKPLKMISNSNFVWFVITVIRVYIYRSTVIWFIAYLIFQDLRFSFQERIFFSLAKLTWEADSVWEQVVSSNWSGGQDSQPGNKF